MGKLVVSLVLALSCAGVASAAEPMPANTATDAAATAAPTEAAAADAAYKPRTEHDNTPWRFNMEQGGQRMTADQFDEWMKSKGVRVAKGAAGVPATTTSEATTTGTATVSDVQAVAK